MDAQDKVKNAATTVADDVREAAGKVVEATTEAVDAVRGDGAEESPNPVGQEPSPESQSDLREMDPDPGNLSGIRDTAGDTVEHS